MIAQDIISTHGPDLFNHTIFIPQYSFRHIENISMISTEFIRLKHEGRIIGKLGVIDEIINDTTIRLDSGEELQADMIISGTGFIRYFPIFSERRFCK